MSFDQLTVTDTDESALAPAVGGVVTIIVFSNVCEQISSSNSNIPSGPELKLKEFEEEVCIADTIKEHASHGKESTTRG